VSESATTPTKRCTGPCGRVLPLGRFAKNASRSDGLQSWCRDCFRERDDANRDAINAYQRRRYAADPDAKAASNQKLHEAAAATVHSHYGPEGRAACCCCGSAEALVIDHLAGGGRAHRLALFGVDQGGYRFYAWLIREGLPPGYQTLCSRCNHAKDEGPRCPLWHVRHTLEYLAAVREGRGRDYRPS
jgi:hypothetical protein